MFTVLLDIFRKVFTFKENKRIANSVMGLYLYFSRKQLSHYIPASVIKQAASDKEKKESVSNIIHVYNIAGTCIYLVSDFVRQRIWPTFTSRFL